MAKITKNRLRKLLAKFKRCLHLRRTAFQFFDLPGELRNIIYRHVLTYEKSSVSYYALDSRFVPRILNLRPNILLACKMTWYEGHSILYGENSFYAHTFFLTDNIMPLMTRIAITDPYLISKVRRFHIEVRLSCAPYHSPRRLKEAFSGVDELEVHVFQPRDGEVGTWLLGGYTAIRRVRRARVYGDIDKELARRLEKSMQSDEGVEQGPWDLQYPRQDQAEALLNTLPEKPKPMLREQAISPSLPIIQNRNPVALLLHLVLDVWTIINPPEYSSTGSDSGKNT